MDSIRRDYRLTVDLHKGAIDARQVEIMQLVPQGEMYYRDYAGGLRPVAGERLHFGELYLVTGLHPQLADAKREAAAELERRGDELRALAVQCQQFEERTNG